MILPLEQQVCSLESAKRLKELGFSQESLFYWYKREHKLGKEFHIIGCGNSTMTVHGSLCFKPDDKDIVYSAYTVAELGELMPNWAATFKATYPEGLRWTSEDGQSPEHKHHGNTEAEARAKMLIYLVEKHEEN